MAATLEIVPSKAISFLEEVSERSEQNLSLCYQCRRCAGACSVGDETGNMTPDRLIRMILTGDKENALNNELVWKCVSCYTCGIRCPNEIQTGRITETLKKMAKEEHLPPRHEKIAHFHHEFFHSGLRWGRVNEMEFMGFYEMKNAFDSIRKKDLGSMIDEIKLQTTLAMKMMKQKRMHMGFTTAKGRKEIKNLYKKRNQKQG